MTTLIPRAFHGAFARRARRRRALWQIAVIVVVALTILTGAGRIGWAWFTTKRGVERLQAQDYVGAEDWFAANLPVNVIEPWLTHYNLGVARYYRHSWTGAQEQFTYALDRAPEEKRCQIVLNLSWSLEAEADGLARRGDLAPAVKRWEAAKAVVEKAQCSEAKPKVEPPPEDSEAADRTKGTPSEQQQETTQRLGSKIAEAPPAPTPDESPNQPKNDPTSELKGNNKAAEAERRPREDKATAPDRSGKPSW